jgi:hypothetical protein
VLPPSTTNFGEYALIEAIEDSRAGFGNGSTCFRRKGRGQFEKFLLKMIERERPIFERANGSSGVNRIVELGSHPASCVETACYANEPDSIETIGILEDAAFVGSGGKTGGEAVGADCVGHDSDSPDGTACLCSPLEEDEFLIPDFNFQAYPERLVFPFLYGQLLFSTSNRWPWADYSHSVVGLFESYARFPDRAKAEALLHTLTRFSIWPQIWYADMLNKASAPPLSWP